MFGILNVNKPAGMTSRAVVNLIHRILQPIKVGHAGTLDPNASGVLVVLIGQAVRLMDAIHTLPKSYVGQFQLGVTSESADTDSPVSCICDAPELSLTQIEQILPAFTGEIEQCPPVYSAVWIDGKRAHTLARLGKEIEMPVRKVRIDSLQMNAFRYPNFELSVTCGSGTYIRSLGRDIARRLGSDAVMTQLIRTAIGPFALDKSVELAALTDKAQCSNFLLPPKIAIEHWAQTFPDEKAILDLGCGKTISEDILNPNCAMDACNAAAVIDAGGQLRALVKRIGENQWRADKFFPIGKP